jgi:hypothetical protein
MVVFDDVSPASKLRIYNRGVERPVTDNYGEFELAYRHGEIVIPYIAWREPLRLECEHFVDCVSSGNRPLSDGEQGLAVVAVLEAAQRSLSNGGLRVPVEMPLLSAGGQAVRDRNGAQDANGRLLSTPMEAAVAQGCPELRRLIR